MTTIQNQDEELLKSLLDDEGRIKDWPSKHARKDAAVRYLATKFEPGRVYTEKEVNEIIDRWHTFGDYFLLRRALIEMRLMERDRRGSQYTLVKQEERAQ